MHKKTKGHRQAVLAAQGDIGQQDLPLVAPKPLRSAILSIAKQFQVSDDEDVAPALSRGPPNPLDDVAIYDDCIIDAQGQQILFEAGDVRRDMARDDLAEKIEALNYYDHTIFGKMCGRRTNDDGANDDGGGDSTIADIVATLESIGLEDSDDDADESDEEERTMDETPDPEANWAPHGSKTMFMLDLLDNLPRLRLSDDHLKAIIWVMRECGTPNVPSFIALRKMQAKLTREVGVKTELHESALGNKFFSNQPPVLLQLLWQAGKWIHEVPLDDLGPMWADWTNAGHQHFYTQEIAQLSSGEFVIPLRWITVNDVVEFDGYLVNYYSTVRLSSYHSLNKFVIQDHTTKRIAACELRYNFLDLRTQYDIVFADCSPNWAHTMPNPLCEIAQGRPMFTIRLMVWGDDVSGNRSKSFNPHMNVYIANASLPHKQLLQEYFVRFSSTSPHASTSEIFTATFRDMKTDCWHTAYDCQLKQEILFRVIGHILPADNPQQAESASIVGGQGNLNCRYDLMGSTEVERETNEGYHAHFSPGTPRRPEQTIEAIKQQYETACMGVKDAVERLQMATGVKDGIAEYWITQLLTKAHAEHQTHLYHPEHRDPRLSDRKIVKEAHEAVKNEIKVKIQQQLLDWLYRQPADSYARLAEDSPDRHRLRPGDHFNPLLKADGINPHQDNTVEILHTYLIGNDKYIWHDSSKDWDKKKDADFAVRLQSSSVDGLTLPPIRANYIAQYKNSLIGKHFKTLQQLAIFHMHDDICTPRLLNLWKASGELGALVWYHEIKNMDAYLEDLQILIDNLLDIWAEFDPRHILYKQKLHVLTHFPQDIRRHGPASLYSTEVFECWNAIFRMCSVLSNHLAPSRDIAVTLADMERFKHQASGGWWKNSSGEYIQAGPRIRNFLNVNKELQRRLGWVDETKLKPGKCQIRLVAKQKRRPAALDAILQRAHLQFPLHEEDVDLAVAWNECKYVVSRSRDVCKLGSWVFCHVKERVVPGRISHILVPSDHCDTMAEHAIVVIDRFDVADENDAHLNMPILTRMNQTKIVHSKDVLFIFNAQHDCATGGCQISEARTTVVQERQQFERHLSCITHTDNDRYLLNMHALHNASLIRETLPRHLTILKRYFSDCKAKHDEFAANLRITGPVKHAETATKAKATREKKKWAKAKGAECNRPIDKTIELQNGSEQMQIGGGGRRLKRMEETRHTQVSVLLMMSSEQEAAMAGRD
ncbi:hypothetical protein EW146_g8209 [Bondarzewia mesenterica]|uniref:Uncharacterized protein n=1 Tax=Bondarzewia mesenterica TaxID=1095465 RepID=A0A4S4LLR6_9AGAM|nr:hypothetical protein EW146_g8209 [Bondarzewia mesenterica]